LSGENVAHGMLTSYETQGTCQGTDHVPLRRLVERVRTHARQRSRPHLRCLRRVRVHTREECGLEPDALARVAHALDLAPHVRRAERGRERRQIRGRERGRRERAVGLEQRVLAQDALCLRAQLRAERRAAERERAAGRVERARARPCTRTRAGEERAEQARRLFPRRGPDTGRRRGRHCRLLVGRCTSNDKYDMSYRQSAGGCSPHA
jgi:hypothetical protein